MANLFDVRIRALRRDRAARTGPELFLHERAFADVLERVESMQRSFSRALLIGCPDPGWPERLRSFCQELDVRDPGELFAQSAGGSALVEDAWLPSEQVYDLVLAVGTLDTVNDLPLALRLIGHALQPGGLLIGAMTGGDTLPRLREAMRAADLVDGRAAPHVHPRIEPAALAPLLTDAGYANPVIDIDRVSLSYESLDALIRDLRRMGATNVLCARPRFVGKAALAAAMKYFAAGAEDGRIMESVEILHFAAWAPNKPAGSLTV
jgi:SAM-dependent methyltransferase